MPWRGWLMLNRHWVALGGVVVLVVMLVVVAGAGASIAYVSAAVAVFLVAVYALTRFVVWASRR